jgi:hypothetical protein
MENGISDDKQQKYGTRIEQQLARDAKEVGELRPDGHGSEPAPTRKAAEREKLRHELEEDIGHRAAGEGGRLRAENDADTTRGDIEDAAKEADRLVGKSDRDDDTHR